MKKLFITTVILISSFCFSQNSEWTYIFDGKSFNGWHQYNGASVGSQWSISNVELIFTNNRDSKQDLVTVNEYSNFELSIEWNISRGGNSGIFFGVKELPEFDEAYKTGPEIQVLDNKNFFKFFEHGWNKIFGKEEDSTSLRSKSLFRAVKGIQNVGTPHDWEDYEKYKKELDKNETD